MKDTPLNRIGKARGMRAVDMAELLGVSVQYISQVNLRQRAVSAELLERMVETFSLTETELLDLLLEQQDVSGEIRILTRNLPDTDKYELAEEAARILADDYD